MNKELMEAMDALEKEKNIKKSTLIEAIQQSLVKACTEHYGKPLEPKVEIDPETGDFKVTLDRMVVEDVTDEATEISLADAQKINPHYELGMVIQVPIHSDKFGRIATQNAKQVILQKIREEERKVLFDQYYESEKDVVTGVVQRSGGRKLTINLGKVDAELAESEQVRTEQLQMNEHVKVFILEVKDTTKGPKILVSRTHPGLVKRLFESEVTEVRDGTVEIKNIAREAGSRTKMAVLSHNKDVDAVGSCVGPNGSRVLSVVNELRGEKIDIVEWDEYPAFMIENALSPAEVKAVVANPDDKTALVVVPDNQLSLAIGKDGQNARLAAKLTSYKIDIKSESQAIAAPESQIIEAVLRDPSNIFYQQFQVGEKADVYVTDIRDKGKGPRILVNYPAAIRRAFEATVPEVRDGTVVIKKIARETGAFSKVVVYSDDPELDVIAICEGENRSYLNRIENDLRGEEVQLIEWDENPVYLLEPALAPADFIFVQASLDDMSALVVVPDDELNTPIWADGVNARLVTRLTGFSIYVKSESQALEDGDFYEDDEEGEYDEEPEILVGDEADADGLEMEGDEELQADDELQADEELQGDEEQ